MKKLFFSAAALLIVTVITLVGLMTFGTGHCRPVVGISQRAGEMYRTRAYGYNPGDLPEILSDKDFAGLPRLARDYGFAGKDFRAKDLSRLSLNFLAVQKFDTHTRWPETGKMPEGHPIGIIVYYSFFFYCVL